jgi:hypothetical protein
MKVSLLIVTIFCVIFLPYCLYTNAQGTGLAITPIIQDLRVNSGETQTFEIKVKHDFDTNADVEVITELEYAIPSPNKEGEAIPTKIKPDDRISPNIILENPDLIIKKGETAISRITVVTPASIKEDGFNYAIIYSLKSTEENKKINIKQRIASLLFLEVGDNTKNKQINIEKFDVPSLVDPFFDTIYIQPRLKFIGKSFFQPDGEIKLVSSGKTEWSTKLNPENKTLLAGTSRGFVVILNSVFSNGALSPRLSPFWFGQKEIIVSSSSFDTNSQKIYISESRKVYFVPYKLILIIILVVLAIFGVRTLYAKSRKQKTKATVKK